MGNRETTRQLKDKRQRKSNLMELNTRQIEEQNEISLQTKDTKKKGMKKLK